MGEGWMAVAHDTLMAAYADRAALHYGREIAIFSLANKNGSGKKIEINRVRVGVSSPLAFTGVALSFGLYRVTGTVTGPLEIRPVPMNDNNASLPTQIRVYYAYGGSPLAMEPSSAIGNAKSTEWGLLRRIEGVWDEPSNATYASTTTDEIGGWMNTLCDVVDFTKMKATDIQKFIIRPGFSLVLAVDSMSGDGAVRADVVVEFEVSNI